MKEMYLALTGAVAKEKQSALVADNLANLSSVGFKRQEAVFQQRPPEVDFRQIAESALAELRLPEPRERLEGDRNYVRVAESFTDFSQGVLQPTERSLDMALERHGPATGGVAFFVVDTPQGERYTRAGAFQIDGDRELVTPDGWKVQSEAGGAIRIEDAPSRPIHVAADGTIFSRDQELGRMRVVVADRPQALLRAGSALYADPGGEGGVRPVSEADGVAVRSTMLEKSNVNVVGELVKMIELQRAYSTYQKSIQTIDEAASRQIEYAMNG